MLGYRLAALATRPLATAFREACVQVRDLALFMLAKNPVVLGVEKATWSRSEAYSMLRSVIVKQLAVTDTGENLCFVEDLKVESLGSLR
jgi:hypothetical protein